MIPRPSASRSASVAVRVTVALAIAAAATASPRGAGAQVIRGTVIDESTGRPVPGVVVVLFDSAGKRLAGVLVGDDGRYAIRSAVAGRFGVRAERIGFRAQPPTPVAVKAGETVDLKLVTSPVPVTLTAVRVSGSTPCVMRASDGREVSEVWEEARKALFATDLTQRQELFNARVSRYERTLDARTRRVTAYQTKEATGTTRSPFVSLPASRLSAEGFVRQSASETVYYGPDAGVLLSEEFLADHCFKLRQGDDKRSGLIGLSFEPARGREKPDIAGTLWIDRNTAQLRDLEFAYQRLPNLPTGVKSADFGGRVEFRHMPTGAWIVERWIIRMPVVLDRGRASQSTDAAIPGLAGSATERLYLAALREEGGEVLETIARGGRQQLATARVALRGVVFDSTRMTPLADARVFLDGTQFATRSAGDGAFTLDSLPEGTYGLSVVHARFDSLGVRAPSQTVTLTPRDSTVVHLAGPSHATIIAADCTAEDRRLGSAALRGRVDDLAGAPAVDAEVLATWRRPGPGTTVNQHRLGTRTDSSGRYALCGIPDQVRVTVRASLDGQRSLPSELTLPAGEVAVVNLPMRTSTVVAVADNVAPESTRSTRPATGATAAKPGMEAVERRRRRGGGSFLTRTQIERTSATRVTDLIRAMPGVSVGPNESGIVIIQVRRTARIARSEGSVTTTGNAAAADLCVAEIRLDGMPTENNGSALDGAVQAKNVEAVEVYSGAQVPVEFATRQASCGVVLIWSRAYAERLEPTPP